MKTFLWFIVLCLVGFVIVVQVYAADVTLTWDANTEPDLTGYKLYVGTQSRTYGDPVEIPLTTLADPASPKHTITVPDGLFHYFAVTAYDNEVPALESDYSNEVICSNGLPPGTVININVNCN